LGRRCRWCGCVAALRGGPLRYVIETLFNVPCPQTGPVLRSGEKLAAGISIWATDSVGVNAETEDSRGARGVEMECCLDRTIRNLGRWSGWDGPIQVGTEVVDSGHWTLKWTGLQPSRPASAVANRCDWSPLPAWQPPAPRLQALTGGVDTEALRAVGPCVPQVSPIRNTADTVRYRPSLLYGQPRVCVECLRRVFAFHCVGGEWDRF
jgi:hypothetical protein